MRKSLFCFALVMTFLITSNAMAFAPTDEQLAAMALDSNTTSQGLNDSYKVYWNENIFLDAVDNRPPEKIAEAFLKNNHKLFNLKQDLSNVKRTKVQTCENSCHIDYQQMHNGLDVQGAKIRISISDGRVQMVNGYMVPDEELKSTENILDAKKISKKQAILIAKDHIGLKSLRHTKIKIIEVSCSIGAIFIPAFKVEIMAQKPLGDYIVMINAYTGKVLSYENVMVYVTGKGKVYKTNPMIAKITTQNLENMRYKSKLSGSFINIINDDTEGAYEESGVFNYDEDNTHFDEVGMYYYMNQIHDFFNTLGFTGLDKPLNATVHYGTDYDNAYFSPWGMEFCFGDGNRLNNLAREAGIAYHEYTHAVTGNICSLAYKNESGAMNEGWSDYFACSLTNDPKIGEWAMAKMNRPWMRNLAEFKKYPDDIQGEVHADGKIWGSICWSIRTALGKTIADKIIHKGRYYVSNYNAKFVEGMDGILEADEALYNGKHKETLLKVFAKHGLKPAKSITTEKQLNIEMEK